jgi:hypothetical protein
MQLFDYQLILALEINVEAYQVHRMAQ